MKTTVVCSWQIKRILVFIRQLGKKGNFHTKTEQNFILHTLMSKRVIFLNGCRNIEKFNKKIGNLLNSLPKKEKYELIFELSEQDLHLCSCLVKKYGLNMSGQFINWFCLKTLNCGWGSFSTSRQEFNFPQFEKSLSFLIKNKMNVFNVNKVFKDYLLDYYMTGNPNKKTDKLFRIVGLYYIFNIKFKIFEVISLIDDKSLNKKDIDMLLEIINHILLNEHYSLNKYSHFYKFIKISKENLELKSSFKLGNKESNIKI